MVMETKKRPGFITNSSLKAHRRAEFKNKRGIFLGIFIEDETTFLDQGKIPDQMIHYWLPPDRLYPRTHLIHNH